jgi:predicted Zn-dependent protease
MLTLFKRLADETLLSSRNVDPYLQTHPLAADRLHAIETMIKASPYYDKKDSASLQRRHDLVRAKLVGFTWSPERVMRTYPITDQSLPAKYARAIATYRKGALPQAVAQIDQLIAADPSDPYFYELKGQALLEGGKAQQALPPLKKAVELAPSASLIRALYGQALIAVGGPANVDQAIATLTVALQTDTDMPAAFRALGRAYAMKDNIPMAELATAQGLFAEGNFKEAKLHAQRAQAKLTQGTPAWLRADDIVSYKAPVIR